MLLEVWELPLEHTRQPSNSHCFMGPSKLTRDDLVTMVRHAGGGIPRVHNNGALRDNHVIVHGAMVGHD